jgi:hypothetical protein
MQRLWEPGLCIKDLKRRGRFRTEDGATLKGRQLLHYQSNGERNMTRM